jgi:hypothetical protein
MVERNLAFFESRCRELARLKALLHASSRVEACKAAIGKLLYPQKRITGINVEGIL